MNFTTITIAGEEYKLSLTTSAIVQVERKLGKSALVDLMKMMNGSNGEINQSEMPMLEDLLIIFHGALQKFNANVSMEKVYALYDLMNEEGYENGPYMELLMKVTEVLSGAFFGKKK